MKSGDVNYYKIDLMNFENKQSLLMRFMSIIGECDIFVSFKEQKPNLKNFDKKLKILNEKINGLHSTDNELIVDLRDH